VTALNDRASVGVGPVVSAFLLPSDPLAEGLARLGVLLILALPFLGPVVFALAAVWVGGLAWPVAAAAWLAGNATICAIGMKAGRELEAGP